MTATRLAFIGSSEDKISNDLLRLLLNTWDYYELVSLTKGVKYEVKPNNFNILVVGGPSPREQLSWLLKIVKRPDMIAINTYETKHEQRSDMRALVREMEEFIGTDCVHEHCTPNTQLFYNQVIARRNMSGSEKLFSGTLRSREDEEFVRKLNRLLTPRIGWIDIRAVKPKQHQHVIYYFKEVGAHIGQYKRTKYGDCFYCNYGYLTGDVTHWMPMPDSMPTVKPFRLIKIKDDFHGKLRRTKICPWCGRHGNIYSYFKGTTDGSGDVFLPVCEYCWAQASKAKTHKRRKKKVVKPNV